MALNKQQQAAVNFNGEHLLLLAGAGTGKTHTIIERIAHLIKSGVDPQRILMLTFTRRAAKEMSDRLYSLVGDNAKLITSGTFHYFCLLLMRRYATMFELQNVTIIDRDDQLQLMKMIRADKRKKNEKFPKASELLSLFSYSRSKNIPPEEYLTKYSSHSDEIQKRLLQIFDEYNQKKQQNRYLDYDDILFYFAKALHHSAVLRNKISSLYDYILVDEMQDTNPLQWMILEALHDPAKLFCVGDDAQSIYAFRGADFHNVHSFTKRIANSEILKLTENYRSTQEILDLANWILDQSPLNYDKHLSAFRGIGVKPEFKDFPNDYEEAGWVVRDIINKHSNGNKWSDQMILVRSAYTARAIEGKLIERSVPYKFIGGTGLLQSSHVKDIFALIKAVANHQDVLSWSRFLCLWPKIGEKTAFNHIQKFINIHDPIKANEIICSTLKNRPEILAVIKRIQNSQNIPSLIITETVNAMSELLEQKYDRWETRLKDFKILVTLSEKYKSIHNFIETYTLETVSNSEAEHEDENDFVTLITVHSAKGTEAKVCYLIKAEPGIYPHSRSTENTDEMEEERRILYVAVTRAKDLLYITRNKAKLFNNNFGNSFFARHNNNNFYNTPQEQPYFLRDIPASLIKSESSVAEKIENLEDNYNNSNYQNFRKKSIIIDDDWGF
ncbi:ATP-dependent helicase [Lentisphaerota bacterium WC36G]|nr:ATP-dependent helicase [Lentisphaerae bacterium WC36]